MRGNKKPRAGFLNRSNAPAVLAPAPEVTATSVTNDTGITISVELANTYKNFTIVAAAYSDGNYTAVGTKNIKRGDTSAEIHIKTTSADSVRIFLWDSLNGMKPMCEGISI